MKVLVTGGSGFVGSYVVQQLIADGHAVRCLVRSEASAERLPAGAQPVLGDVLDTQTLIQAFDNIDGVIHLVGIIEEQPKIGITFERLHIDATRNVAEAARQAGIKTFIQMSANGAREDGVSRYQTSKWSAEQIIMNAGFASWTIFRPSFVFGDPGPDNPEFVTQLARSLVVPFPILPVFGDGQYSFRPVAIQDVARAVSSALTNPKSNKKIYSAVGNTEVTYDELLDIITESCGIEIKMKIHQPLLLARLAVNTLGRLGLLPISPDQFEMLIEGNTGNPSTFHDDFDINGIPFTSENLSYVRKYIAS